MGELRLLTAGESHGAKLAAILEGLPAGLTVDEAAIERELTRRRGGYGRGQRARSIEQDRVSILAGVRLGETIGAPVLLEIENRDHESWREVMDVRPREDRSRAEERKLRRPRPGHADLAGMLKYGRHDLRDVLERASARGTAIRVAAGAIAKQLLRSVGVEIHSWVNRIGPAAMAEVEAPPGDLAAAARTSPVSCPDPRASEAMCLAIDEARRQGDTLGGTFRVVATGVPAGWGSYAEWDRRLDGRVAQALMSIPAVKAVELGLGAALAALPGSQAHDEIHRLAAAGAPETGGFVRPTNRAGGLEGGVSNGAPISALVSLKPISTLARPLASVDLDTGLPAPAAYERSDTCAVPAAAVIGEAALAWCLAHAALEAYGGDCLADFTAAHQARLGRFARA